MSTVNFSKVDGGFQGAQVETVVEGQVPAQLLMGLGKLYCADRDADRQLARDMMGILMAFGAQIVEAIKAENELRIEQRETAERNARWERHQERRQQQQQPRR